MLAMQRSYKALKDTGTDLHCCEGKTIKHFFEQVGLQKAWEFDNRVTEFSEREMYGKSGKQQEG